MILVKNFDGYTEYEIVSAGEATARALAVAIEMVEMDGGAATPPTEEYIQKWRGWVGDGDRYSVSIEEEVQNG